MLGEANESEQIIYGDIGELLSLTYAVFYYGIQAPNSRSIFFAEF